MKRKVKINPHYESILTTMKNQNGLTKEELLSMVNFVKFRKYVLSRYGEPPLWFKDNQKYRMPITEHEREYQSRRLGGYFVGFMNSCERQVKHILSTTTDEKIKELGAILYSKSSSSFLR